MELDSFRPILSGLVGALAVYFLARAGRKPASRVGSRRKLSYGIGVKAVAVLLVPGSLFVAYAAAHARPSQLAIAAVIAAAFLVAAPFLVYQAFLISFEYDDENIYYRSPLAGSHVIPWPEVVEVGYSRLMQAHYLSSKQVHRIWCSTMLRGFSELGEFLSRKHEELYGPEP